MTPTLRIVACALAGALWLLALTAKHFWPDIDINLFTMTCASAVGALGIHGMATGSGSTPGNNQGGFARVGMLALLAAASVLLLGGCSTAAVAWEAAAVNQVRIADDNALRLWKQSGCALTVGAVLRDPTVIDPLKSFCRPGGNVGDLNTVAK